MSDEKLKPIKPNKSTKYLKKQSVFFKILQNYVLIVFLGFLVADLISISTQSLILPKNTPPLLVFNQKTENKISRDIYQIISKRNIFNHKGVIAPPLSRDQYLVTTNGEKETRSQLPLKLLGTIVHINPARSVASVHITSLKKKSSYKAGDSLEKMATLIKIERRKIIFKNNKTGRTEYISLPEDSSISFSARPIKKTKNSSDIVKKGNFKFQIKRSDLKKHTRNLATTLNQARMLPYTIGGQVKGFRFVSIKPNSIYTELGFKPGDIIKKVNGEQINSPSQAMELYKALKSSNQIELSVERRGRLQTFNYEIR